jgi:hypothetical protein
MKDRVEIDGNRVLFFDGHGSHLTFECLDFCEKHPIIPISFRLRTSYIAQLLDSKPFSKVKQAFRKENTLSSAWFCLDSAKRQFLEDFTTIREKAFKQRVTRSAFQETVLWPFNLDIIIGPMQ